MFLHLETKWSFETKSVVFECRNFPNAYFSILFMADFSRKSNFPEIFDLNKGCKGKERPKICHIVNSVDLKTHLRQRKIELRAVKVLL